MLKNITCSLMVSICLFTSWHSVCAQSSAPPPQFWIAVSRNYYYFSNPTVTSNAFSTTNLLAGAPPDAPIYGDFDTILSQIYSNVSGPLEIHLFPGVYYTSGSYGSHNSWISSGWSIRGAGISATTIRNGYVPTSLTAQAVIAGTSGNSDNIAISGLTTDYGTVMNSNIIVRNGIFLPGNGCWVQNVKAMGVYGSTSTGQGCGIYVGESGSSTNLIEGCEVSGAYGNDLAALYIVGSGIVHNNTILLPPSTSTWVQGIVYADGQHLTIDQNYINGGYLGVTTGYGPTCSNIVTANNTFENLVIAYGVGPSWPSNAWQDIYFTGNLVHTAAGNGVWAGAASTSTFTNLVIARNMFIPWDTSSAAIVGNPVNTGGPVYNINVFGNVFPTNSVMGNPGYDNVDLTGEIYNGQPGASGVYNQANAVGSLPTLICSSTNWPSSALTVWNTYTIVTSVGGTNWLELPEISWSDGRPGTQMTIAVMDTNACVTLYPGGAQCFKVNGSFLGGVVLYGTNPPARFISDNTGVWNQY